MVIAQLNIVYNILRWFELNLYLWIFFHIFLTFHLIYVQKIIKEHGLKTLHSTKLDFAVYLQ